MVQYLYKAFPGIALLSAALLLAACSTTPHTPVEHRDVPGQNSTPQHLPHPDTHVEYALYDQYQQWKGVRYRYGGLSKSGVDCSGFVYRTFRDKLGRNIPRTTSMQSREGYRIDRRDLRSGDLVFFRPPGSKQHVGIYLEDGMFMHASTSVGVTISRLDNRYWRKSYWQSRRVPL